MAETRDFPIVGVGASAGGLDAHKSFLRSLPKDGGAAFILIQHLDPDHESVMADLLARETDMPVVQAEDGAHLSPNRVYVIPPGKFIRLHEQELFLDDPPPGQGFRMAIDYFFRTLAEVRGERAIAVVLSGTGSDGTLGIQEIKAAGGVVMVQSPADAEYDGMPNSAIATGLVDVVAPAAEMAGQLAQILRHPFLRPNGDRRNLVESEPDRVEQILQILLAETRYDFHSYKKATVERRIRRRMGLRQVETLRDYVERLRDTPEEVEQLFRDLLIGVTRFFREPSVWDAFAETVIDPLIRRKPRGTSIRAWVPGCASGEEAYSLAIALFDRIDRQNARMGVQIFGTDLNDRAIAAARAGVYPAAAAADIPDALLKTYFEHAEDATIRVNKRVREAVVFAKQNVISDPPFSKLDLISCRNLMIYLEADVQRRMIEMFHFALADDGHLLLGTSENADRPGQFFVPVDKPRRIYRKSAAGPAPTSRFTRQHPDRRPAIDGAATGAFSAAPPAEDPRQILLERFAPASVLVDRNMDVQFFHGPVRHYLDFPSGKPTRQLPDMVVPALRTKLRAALNRVIAGRADADFAVPDVPRNGHRVTVQTVVEALPGTERGPQVLVHFRDLTEPRDAAEVDAARSQARAGAAAEDGDHVATLEYELKSSREDLQSTIEEMETANEEMKASNEEIMSMNEELQSSNEELETSREELQSLNEELSTVNGQLEDKIEELERSNNDLNNLLVSTDLGVIFLDTDLLIRRFTPAMRDIVRIIQSDVGRPVEDLAMRVDDPALIADAKRCLERLTEVEAEISTTDGSHRLRRLRPYRTAENRIEGVVIAYHDVTNLQNARTKARRRAAQQAAVAELGREALSGVDLEALFALATHRLSEHLGTRFTKVLQLDDDHTAFTLRAGVGWSDQEVGVSKVENSRRSQAGFTLAQQAPVVVRDFATETRFSAPKILRDHQIVCGASVLIGPVDRPWGVLGVHESHPDRCALHDDDVNFVQAVANTLWVVIARDNAIGAIEAERRQLRNLTDSLPILFAIIDSEKRYEFVNRAYEAWGQTADEIEGRLVEDMLDAAGYAQVAPHIDAALRGEARTFEIEVQPFGSERVRSSLVTYVPRQDGHGQVTGFYSASLDIAEPKRLKRDLEERYEQYRTLGESIPFGVWIADADGRLEQVSQSFLDLVGMEFDAVRDDGWMGCLEPETREETRALWAEARKSGTNWAKEHRIIGADGALSHVLALGRAIRNAEGQITSWVGLNLDITDRKAEEDRLAAISAELDHRVKNILATVSTISRMTGQTAETVEDYRTALQSRIRAMALAHKLLAEADWRGMQLDHMVRTVLGPYLSQQGDMFRIGGPDLALTPWLVQTFALALHELATNSAKYGALAVAGGTVEIRWRVDDRTEIEWIESGLKGVVPPEREGFGTTLLTRILAAQGVEVDLDYRDSGLRATMTLGEV